MNKKISVFWAFITVLVTLGAIILCFFGSSNGVLYASPSGNPQDAVNGFFNALKAGNYTAACSYVDGYSSLGFENEPASEEGKILFSALKASYDYYLSSSCVLDGAKASQKVLVSFLDIAAADEAAKSMSGTEYTTALRQVLAESDNYRASEYYDVTVVYTGGRWLISLDNSLLAALQGSRV